MKNYVSLAAGNPIKEIAAAMFENGVENLRSGKCVRCSKPIHSELSFKSQLSVREYHISGLCEPCQDEVFKYQ